ncbi:GTPase HflX [candidate division KSB1 bacterium]
MNQEKALVVGIYDRFSTEWEIEENMKELLQLSDTAGLEVSERTAHEIREINPKFFIGKGKAEKISRTAGLNGANCVIFDVDLSPSQARNLEKVIGKKIIDRTGLILDIFAKNARTKEAKSQVELAQLKYLLPRLTRYWTHLSRQEGGVGIGLRGPGETQLEVDRRNINKRIKKLSDTLEKFEKRRLTRSKKRKELFKAALVGYTNTGKSTLLNAITKSDVLVENKLFATLDSTVRKVKFKNQFDILLSDTVGFIRKLPHHLIASFKSTLGEAKEADLLIHLADITHPQLEEQISSVNEVLESLEILNKPTLMVFNKLDVLKDDSAIEQMKYEYQDAVFISAKRGIGLNHLLEAIINYALKNFIDEKIDIPFSKYKYINKIKKIGKIISTSYEKDHISIHFKAKKEDLSKVRNILGE